MSWPWRRRPVPRRPLPLQLRMYADGEPPWVGYALEALEGWGALIDDGVKRGYVVVPYCSWNTRIHGDAVFDSGQLPDKVQIWQRSGGLALDVEAGQLMFAEADEVWARIAAQLTVVWPVK